MANEQSYLNQSREQIEKLINDCVRKWVNLQTFMDDGWTALHLSCKTSNEVFMYLLELGADTRMNNRKDMTLMHKAAYDDNTYLITYLRDKLNFNV